jgi:hypothetical protein
MEYETLETLKAAFDDWRSKKRYAHESMPAELLARARISSTSGLNNGAS